MLPSAEACPTGPLLPCALAATPCRHTSPARFAAGSDSARSSQAHVAKSAHPCWCGSSGWARTVNPAPL